MERIKQKCLLFLRNFARQINFRIFLKNIFCYCMHTRWNWAINLFLCCFIADGASLEAEHGILCEWPVPASVMQSELQSHTLLDKGQFRKMASVSVVDAATRGGLMESPILVAGGNLYLVLLVLMVTVIAREKTKFQKSSTPNNAVQACTKIILFSSVNLSMGCCIMWISGPREHPLNGRLKPLQSALETAA